jgi:hypothetical protein
VKKGINIFRASMENREVILKACNIEQNEKTAINFNIHITCLKQQYGKVRRKFFLVTFLFFSKQNSP